MQLIDPHTNKWLDPQGPAGAFAQLDHVAAVGSKRFSKALLQHWRPLVSSLRARFRTDAVRVQLWLGDGATATAACMTGCMAA